MTTLLDGTSLSQSNENNLAKRVTEIKDKTGTIPI